MQGKWRENLIKIKPYVAGEQSNDKDMIKLNANENPYPPSPQVKKVFEKYAQNSDGLKKYPNSDSIILKDAIAQRYNVNRNNVFVGNGSDDVIALSFMAFFNSDKPILYPDITYSFYPVWCSLIKIPYKTIPVDENFEIHAEDYYTENGGIIIPNPNAPTSICKPLDFVINIVEHNPDSVVIIDEAYVDFGGESAVELTKKYENLLVTQTFSKSRSLAGMRIGFAIGSEELIATLETVKNSYNSYVMDSIALEVGTASVNDEEYFKECVNKVIATRERVRDELIALGFDVKKSATNFLFATHKEYSAKEIFEYLKTKKIFIRYFNVPRIDNYLRISIGRDEEMDKMTRKYGYKGRDYVLDLFNKGAFDNKIMSAAHLIQGSSDGRFTITYCTKPENLSKEEINSVGYEWMDYNEAASLYNPDTLKEGWNTLENGEEIYFVKTPALGLWKVD